MAAIPIANLSAVVTGALEAARAIATEMLPAAVTRDAVVEASRASAAWLTSHLWAWLAVAVDSLPASATAAAASAADASGPCLQTAARLLGGAYGWLAAAVVQKLPDVAAEKMLGDAAAWLAHGSRGGAVHATLALALLAAAFLAGAAWALACRSSMTKGPAGLGRARVPRGVRTARRRRAGGAGCKLLLPVAGLLVVASAACLAAKMLY